MVFPLIRALLNMCLLFSLLAGSSLAWAVQASSTHQPSARPIQSIADISKDDQYFADLERPASKYFTDRDGLPQNDVRSLAVDRNGYIWAGTRSGVACYNGRTWTVVNTPEGTLNSRVNAIAVTADGSLWFATDVTGVFHLKNGVWETFNTQNSGLPSNSVWSLLALESPSSPAKMWFGTNRGLACLEAGKWTVYTTQNSGLPDDGIWCMQHVSSDTGTQALWVGTNEGLARFENGIWTVFDKNSGLPQESNSVTCLAVARSATGNQVVWVGILGAGIACYEAGKWTYFNSSNSGLLTNQIWSMLVTTSPTGSQTVWVSTLGAGLVQYESGKWSVFDSSDKTGLTGIGVLSLLETKSPSGARTLWVGTFNSGLIRYDFNRWKMVDIARSGLSNHQLTNLIETTNESGHRALWISSSAHGIACYEAGKWTIYNTHNSPLPNDQVRTLFATTSETTGQPVLWIGTYGSGVARLEAGQWQTFNTQNSGLPSNQIWTIQETVSITGERAIWIGTNVNGLARYQNRVWTTFTPENSPLPDGRIDCLQETISADQTQRLWMGTGNGLVCYQDGQWTTYTPANSGLRGYRIHSLAETVSSEGKHFLWAGTSNGGVSRLDLEANPPQWLTITTSSTPGLPSDSVFSILSDQQHRVYLFTSKGVARLTPRQPTVANPSEYDIFTFTAGDGLPGNECLWTSPGAFVDHQGRIWAGTVNGIGLFDPTQEIVDTTAKPLYVERVLVNGNPIDSRKDSQVFDFKHNNLSFECALLGYFREEDTRYAVQLLGYDPSPSAWTPEYKAVYTNLGEGSYTFNVWGKDYAGNLTGPAQFRFRIKPAPWRSWWAYGIYSLGAIFLLYGGLRLRVRALHHKNEILEAKIAQRTQELAKAVEITHRKNQELQNANQELLQSQQQADRIFSALAEALPGTILDHKYRLDHKIGSGGFGAVFQGTQLDLNRKVAIKVFRPSSGNDSTTEVERFRREGMAACQINHPNAISVYDSGISEEGIAYIVMELLEGHTLSKELSEEKTLSLRRCRQILEPLCSVLTEAHRAGIIHRDIKPDNIFLHSTPTGEMIKVVDFGIAKLVSGSETGESNLTRTGAIIGTPTYMAPERLSGKHCDGKADVYSVGVLLYEMLCGRLPFQMTEEGIIDLILRQIKEQPESLRAWNPNIPHEIETLILKTLEKSPEARPSPQTLWEEFSKLCEPYLTDDNLTQIVKEETTQLPIAETMTISTDISSAPTNVQELDKILAQKKESNENWG